MTSPTKSGRREEKKKFVFSLWPFFVFGGLMVLIKLTETLTGFDFGFYGLKPRIPVRLFAIFSFPFLHADWMHLSSNLLPFGILSILIYNVFRKHFLKIFLFTFFLSGFWTWCFARPGTIIGASGWVYALLGFLLTAGFLKTNRRTMVLAGGLAFLYGGMVYGLVPSMPGISWEAHLMGLLAGVAGAVYWHRELSEVEENSPKPETYSSQIDIEPPYPYWLYKTPHVLDALGNVIHPDDLVWENGRPFIKPAIEIQQPNPLPEIKPMVTPKPNQNHIGSPILGQWYISVG
jgi:membrane associated rhomboid family serine protease